MRNKSFKTPDSKLLFKWMLHDYYKLYKLSFTDNCKSCCRNDNISNISSSRVHQGLFNSSSARRISRYLKSFKNSLDKTDLETKLPQKNFKINEQINLLKFNNYHYFKIYNIFFVYKYHL